MNNFQAYADQAQSQRVLTLVVYVHVINDDGGIANASDFTFYVLGDNPSPSSFPGSETGTEGY